VRSCRIVIGGASLQSDPQKSLIHPNRTIVVGDLHGCYDELLDLLAQLSFTANDRLLTVGDLIVKGPKNREVLDLFSSDERFSSVIGNHDLALLRYWRGESTELYSAQKQTHDELADRRERYQSYLESLPLMIDLGSHVIVHAGVRPGVPLAEQSLEDLTELRTLGENRTRRQGTPWYKVYDGEKFVFFGHWPAQTPRRGPKAMGLDTGCVYGHSLSAYIIDTKELVSVPARLVYRPAKRTSAAMI
jgi:hypothetical protein